jgi:hypothetical protein
METREVLGQLGRKFRISGEESSKGRRIERSNRVGVEPFLGKCHDRFGAEDFQVRLGETIAQKFYRWQSEDEIADGTAANDQDAVQVSNA